MNMEEGKLELVNLCKEFLKKATKMYFKGIITKEEFEKLSENKIDFLKDCGIGY